MAVKIGVLHEMGTTNKNLGLYQAKERAKMLTTGNVFFVDSGASLAVDSTAHGDSPERPFATLDYAVGRCTANNDDVIYVMAGHSETLTADSAVDLDVAGVRVLGLGKGADRPTFNFTTATAADFKLAAANVSIDNLLFTNGIDDQDMMLETSADDVEVANCEFRNDSSTQALIFVNIGVASNDSDRFYLHNCRFVSDTASATSAISVTALQAGVRIEDNYVRGDYSDAAVQSAVIQTDCVVKGNYLQNDNNTAHAIQFSDAATGIVQNNVLVTDAIATALDLGSCAASGNMYQDDGDTDVAATEIPLTVTTGGLSLQSIDDLHAVPAQDATTDANMRDVLGKKDDTASEAIATTDSVVSYLKGLMQGTVRTAVSRAVGTTTTPKTLFTITGGSIHVLSIVGTVVTAIQNQTTTQQLQAVVTTPSATVNMSTAVDTDNDGVGAVYHFLGETGVLTPVDAGLVILPLDDAADGTDKPTQWIVPVGLIGVDGGAVSTGDVDWVMTYIANSGATVVAA